MKKIKVICFLMVVLLFLFISSGCSDSAADSYSTISQIHKSDNHIEQIHDYDTPYTICYKNKDYTYSMYVFSFPVQYKKDSKYEIIDCSVVETEYMNFKYENKANTIKTYFPKTLNEYFLIQHNDDYIKFKPRVKENQFAEAKSMIHVNMYGDKVSAVLYEGNNIDMLFYPTKAGIKTEIVLKEDVDIELIEYIVDLNSDIYENKKNSYVLFKNESENKSIIHQPLVKYYIKSNEELDATTRITVNKHDEKYLIKMAIPENISGVNCSSVKIDTSFDVCLNTMPDSSVYSKHNENSYLSRYTAVGNSDTFGIGRHYIRYRFNYFFECDPETVISSSYHIKELSSFGLDNKVFFYQVEKQWSSTGLNWENKINYGKAVIEYKNYKGTNKTFDITNFTKECFADQSWMLESFGLLMKGDEEKNKFSFFATSDDSQYSPYIKIDLKRLPKGFIYRDSINP